MSRTSSGSTRSECEVNPTRSTNRTDTTFRSSRAPTSPSSLVPHEEQKRASAESCAPHVGHIVMRAVYDAGAGRTRHGFGGTSSEGVRRVGQDAEEDYSTDVHASMLPGGQVRSWTKSAA